MVAIADSAKSENGEAVVDVVPNDRFLKRQLIAERIRKTIDERTSLGFALNKIREAFGENPIEIYEAGGGARPISARWFPHARTTVVDLERTNSESATVDAEFIEGDIQNFCPADVTFDLIICYYVLEHVAHPEKALENFCALAKPNGLVFIASPCFWSLNALVAKLTPFWFHVWFYKIILKKTMAGTKGKAPFRTHHSIKIDPNRLIEYFSSRNFETVYQRKFLNGNMKNLIKSRPILVFWLEITVRMLNFVSFYSHDFGEGDFHLVFKKISD